MRSLSSYTNIEQVLRFPSVDHLLIALPSLGSGPQPLSQKLTCQLH